MKRLIKKLFKIEPQLEYIIAEYQPIEITRLKTGLNFKENNINKPINEELAFKTNSGESLYLITSFIGIFPIT